MPALQRTGTPDLTDAGVGVYVVKSVEHRIIDPDGWSDEDMEGQVVQVPDGRLQRTGQFVGEACMVAADRLAAT